MSMLQYLGHSSAILFTVSSRTYLYYVDSGHFENWSVSKTRERLGSARDTVLYITLAMRGRSLEIALGHKRSELRTYRRRVWSVLCSAQQEMLLTTKCWVGNLASGYELANH